MFWKPSVVAALEAVGVVGSWALRAWVRGLGALSPRAAVEGAVVYLDLSWQRGREAEAARRALAAAPEGVEARAGLGEGVVAARLACLLAPPGGAFPLPAEEGRRMAALAPLPASFLPLSPGARRRLELLGLSTLGRLQALSRETLWELLGREGELVWWWARGVDPRPFPGLPRGGGRVEVEGELPACDLSPEALAQLALLLCRAAFAEAEGRGCRGLELSGETSSGAPYRLSMRFPVPVSSPREAARALARRLLASPPPAPLVRARLALVGLRREWGRQEGLLVGARDRQGLLEAARELEERYGRPLLFRPLEVRPWEERPERRWALSPLSP